MAIRQHNMLALSCNPETRLLKRAHGIQVVDASDFGQTLHPDLDFADTLATELFLDDSQVLTNGFTDIVQGFLLRVPLRPAARQSRHRDAVAFLRVRVGGRLS